MVEQLEIKLPEFPRGYHLITSYLTARLKSLPQTGLLNVFIQHTSAALTINESADPSVRVDFEMAMNQIVPENMNGFTHTLEGADDMPAHIKAALIGQSINIPITNGALNLGTWQGLFLCEFRNYGGSRKLVVTICS
jgi:secondary thiamine-phosphate synthase enzyme